METLGQLKSVMRCCGVSRLYIKRLAPNDNSKNQIYLGGDYSVLNILPFGEIRTDVSRRDSKRDRYKVDINLEWLTDTEATVPAPSAQLILYPKYPEVRLSGFLKGCGQAPSPIMTSRDEGRILFLGIRDTGSIVAYAAGPRSGPANEVAALKGLPVQGVFEELILDPAGSRQARAVVRESDPSSYLAAPNDPLQQVEFEERVLDSTGLASDAGIPGKGVIGAPAVTFTGHPSGMRLLQELGRVHRVGWIAAKLLRADGSLIPCRASNCGGYTLEAELGVSANGYAEPDFMGWEVKQHGVNSLDRPHVGVVTLMTPEPTGGAYKQGVENFVRRFGYCDRRGRPDRLNFGGVYRAGKRVKSTGLTLQVPGFDAVSSKITDIAGSIALYSDEGECAAEWGFPSLMKHWNRKHAKAVYVPSLCRKEPERSYRYGSTVDLGMGTDFTLFLAAMAGGRIYYDPGIKLENASTPNPVLKRRSQFRVKPADICALYKSFSSVKVAC